MSEQQSLDCSSAAGPAKGCAGWLAAGIMRLPGRRRAFALLSVAMFMALATAPLHALAESPPPVPAWTTEGTPWAEASSEGLKLEDVQRFVAIWMRRAYDEDWINAYMGREGPAGDGFDDLAVPQKQHLVLAFLSAWHKSDPDWARRAWTGDPGVDQERFRGMADTLYAFFFTKDAWLAGFRASADSLAAPDAIADSDADAGIQQFPGLSRKAITAHFDRLHERNRMAPSQPVPPRPDVEMHEPDPEVFADDAVARDAGATTAPGGAPDRAPEAATDAGVEDVLGPLLGGVTNSGTFRACGSLAAGPEVCSGDVPLGTPVGLDLDGNVLTGVLGSEVEVSFGPTLDPAFPAGIAMQASATRTQPHALSGPLAAQAYVLYYLDPAEARILAGFDGRDGSLGDSNLFTFTLEDLEAALQGDVAVRAQATRTGPAGPTTLLVGHASQSSPSEQPVDPLAAALRFAPAPGALTARVHIAPEAPLTIALEAPGAPEVTAGVEFRSGMGRFVAVGEVEDIPAHVDLSYYVDPYGSTRTITTNASGVIPVMGMAATVIPDVNFPSQTTIQANATGVPAKLKVNLTGPMALTYNASAPLTQATAVFADYDGEGLESRVAIAANQVPRNWTLLGTDAPFELAYDADAPMGGLGASLYFREGDLNMAINVTGVSRHLRLHMGSDAVRFTADEPVDLVRGKAWIRSAPLLFPPNHVNHLYLRVIEHAAGPRVAVDFRMSEVLMAEHTVSGEYTVVRLQMGGGEAFRFRGDLRQLDNERFYADATLSNLPTNITAWMGESFEVVTDANFDLAAYVHHGRPAALANTPPPPFLHGFSLRDGASGTDRAIKARVYLTGLPRYVLVVPQLNLLKFEDWRPTAPTLFADIELDSLLPVPVDAFLSIGGLPPQQSILTRTWIETFADGSQRSNLGIDATAPMGPVFADAAFGPHRGRVTVSNVPADMLLRHTQREGQTVVNWTASGPIAAVSTWYRVDTPLGAPDQFQAYANLTDVPSQFGLTVGRDAAGGGPDFAYQASASTLDAEVYVDASLWGGDLTTRISAGFEDLGALVQATASPAGVELQSSPPTALIYTNVWAEYHHASQDSGVINEGGVVELPWGYNLRMNVDIDRLGFALTNVASFGLAWGAATKVTGDYQAFAFGWEGALLDVDYGFAIALDFAWWIPILGWVIWPLIIAGGDPDPFYVNVWFHTYTEHLGAAYHEEVPFGWCHVWFHEDMRPHPHGASLNGATTTTPAEGGAWWIVPNPQFFAILAWPPLAPFWGPFPAWVPGMIARGAAGGELISTSGMAC